MSNKIYFQKLKLFKLIIFIPFIFYSCANNEPSDKIVTEQIKKFWTEELKNDYTNFIKYCNQNTITTTFLEGYPITKDLNISEIIIVDRGDLTNNQKTQRIKINVKGSKRFEEFINNNYQDGKNITKYDRVDKGIHDFSMKNIYLFVRDDFGNWTCTIGEKY